jgi:predicted LPLAT superfamily acyltransferase
MSVAWQAEPERGNRLLIRLMAWVALTLGRPAARALLHPICLYYLVRSSRANRALRTFYERAAGRPAGWRRLYRHYHCFASTILDRVYFLRGRFDLFKVTVHGLEALDPLVTQGRGCLLLGAHLGSFEAVRALGSARAALEIRVLMDEQNAPLIRALIKELNPEVAETVIQIGGATSLLPVKECLDRGGVVGVMGDRLVQEEQAVECRFFGRPAKFPSGTMRLAHVARAPVVLFFGLYRGGNRYDVYLEPFSDEVRLSPEDREADLQRWTQRYADRLAHFCRQAPDNWFNFYDVWGTS